MTIIRYASSIVTVMAVCALASFPLRAQNAFDTNAEDVPQSVALTLQSAEDYAIAHNRDIMNAGIEIRKAEAKKWQAIASMLPQVSASLDYSNYFGYRMDLGAMSLAMPAYGTLGVTSSVAFSGAQVVAVQIASISKKMSDISLNKTIREITDQVKNLYYSALVLERTIELLDDNYDSLRKLHDMTTSSVKVGVMEQTSADQILVQVNTMADNISSTKRSLEMAYNTMRLLLGLNEKTEITLLQSLDSLVNVDEIKALANEKFDITNNYDYQLLKQSTELSRKQVSLAGWGNGPTLSVFHQYTGKKYFSDEATMNMTPPNMMGVSLKIPVFTSLRNTMEYKSAKLSYRQQFNTKTNAETSLMLQYRQQVYNLNSTLERYNTQVLNVSVAQRVFNNTAMKFEYGVSSSMDVTQAMGSLVTAQSSYLQSLLEMLNAQTALEQLLNK